MRPRNFINGNRCPFCNKHTPWTTESFRKEISSITNGEYEVISEYSGRKNKITLKHYSKNGTHEIIMRADDFMRGERCAICANCRKKTTDDFKKRNF